MEISTEMIVGYPVSLERVDALANLLVDEMRGEDRSCRYFACLNPHSVETAAGDPDFREALLAADFLTADGVGIVYASRLTGGRIAERVTGTDVFESLTAAMNAVGGMSCFFLGSTDDTLAAIREKFARDYPNVRIAGTYSPPFKPTFDVNDVDEMLSRINSSGCDVLWVGMTAPKQETWIYQNRARLDVAFAGPIGAVFDFYAGNVKRSGPIWQRLGLEWLPRLVQEPRRLWRRTLVSSPAFLFRCVKHKYFRGT